MRRTTICSLMALGLMTGCYDGLGPGPRSTGQDSGGGREASICPSVERVAGSNRFETAVRLAEAFRPDAQRFVLVGGGGVTVDAVAAGPLAARLQAPILVSDPQALPTELDQVIDPGDEVVVLGGSAALSEEALDALRDRGAVVERIAGSSRYATAAEVALRFESTATAIVASGENAGIADALVGSAAGAHLGVPVLLVERDHVPEVTAAALEQLGVERTIVIGGTAAVSDQVLGVLPDAQRIAGDSRFETAAEVTDMLDLDMSTALLVEATPSADAVAATALGLPLVYATPDGVPEASLSLVSHAEQLVLIGGAAVLSERVEAQACGILDPDVVPEPEVLVSCSQERADDDRPDDTAHDQVRILYVLPSDAPDEELDKNDQICRSVLAWNGWLERQTGGASLRLDRHDGRIDIGFVRLDRTDAEMRGSSDAASIDDGVAFVRDRIERELSEAGLLQPNKLYAVYYGGTSAFSCGGGALPPELPGQVAAVYLDGQPPGFDPCDTRPWGDDLETPRYLDYAMIHELVHTMGFVSDGAPHHHASGHVFDTSVDVPQRDLMYAPRDAGDPAWDTDAALTLDIGGDDYFAHGNPDVPDLARSTFMNPLPAGAERPPGS